MGKALRVLIVEDSEDDAILVARELGRGGYELTYERVDTAAGMRDAFARLPWEAVIADYAMPYFNALVALEIARSHDPDIPFIVVSGTIGEDIAVETMRAGANDYVMKGNLARVAPAMERELRDAQRRRSGRAAQEAVTRLATAIEQAGEAVVITNVEGTIHYANPAFERVTGYSREEVLGRNPRILKSGKHDDAFYEDMWDTVTRGETWSGRLTNKRKDGTLFEEEASISPVRDGDGKTVDYVAVKRDVTKEVALEAQLHQAQKMEAVAQLAGGVAHDFNNLLTVISGYANLAKDTLPDGHKAIQALRCVQQATDQAAGVTRSLLTFSHKTGAKKEPVELQASVEASLRLLRQVLPAGIEVVTDTACEPVWVHADETQLQQIIMNLAINARDAMPDGGTLKIAVAKFPPQTSGSASLTDPQAPVARLVVSDSGTGMEPDVRERIFDPFFTTKPKGQGTGLGLAIIHSIIEDHNGSIRVVSEPGQGTTFTVELPLFEINVSQGALEGATPPKQGRGQVVLLAEDNRHVRGIIASALESLDYEVVQANDGSALMDCFERHRKRIELLILDVDPPKRNGLDCLGEIRTGGAEAPAIVITGSADVDLENRLDENTALLRKPFQIADLTKLAGSILAARRQREERT